MSLCAGEWAVPAEGWWYVLRGAQVRRERSWPGRLRVGRVPVCLPRAAHRQGRPRPLHRPVPHDAHDARRTPPHLRHHSSGPHVRIAVVVGTGRRSKLLLIPRHARLRRRDSVEERSPVAGQLAWVYHSPAAWPSCSHLSPMYFCKYNLVLQAWRKVMSGVWLVLLVLTIS